MEHKVHHGLEKGLAKKAMDKAIEAYTQRFEKYNPEANWVEDDKVEVGFSAKGVSVDGTIELNDEDMVIDLDVPFLLKPFKSKAVGVIEEEINKWVGKAKEGELDEA